MHPLEAAPLAKLVRAEIGWLGELAVDEANVVESGGRLIPWIPLVDAHGVDRAYTWDGVDAPWFVQVKTSGFTDAEGRHRWDLRVGSFAASDRFAVVLALFDPTSNRIVGKPTPVGPSPYIAAGPSGLWVADFTTGELLHLTLASAAR